MMKRVNIKKTYVDNRINSIRIKIEEPTSDVLQQVIEELADIRTKIGFREVLEIVERVRHD